MRKTMMKLNEMRAVAGRFRNDEDGAALIEYTVLLGVLLVAVITIIAGVGGWVSTKWTALNTSL